MQDSAYEGHGTTAGPGGVISQSVPADPETPETRPAKAPLSRVVGFIGISLCLLLAFTPLPNLLSRLLAAPSRVGPADAIVVLGGRIQPDGTLGNDSLRRALDGVTLHRRGLAPLLVFSGQSRSEGPSEAEVRRQLARDLGVSPEQILTAVGALTTREEATRVRALLRPRNAQRILLVTDSQHLARAIPVFERAGFDVLGVAADELSSHVVKPEARLELMRLILIELLARLYYRAAGFS